MQIKTEASHIVSVAAPAKINLGFDIIGQRTDGYHDVVTLFQSVDLQDFLCFKFLPCESKKTELIIFLRRANESIERELFPLDDENSIAKAVHLFLSNLSNKPIIDVEITIEKNIPIGAGLAGGSTDAAATLLALNSYFKNPFTENELIELASLIGSDTAFCLIGGLAIGRGRGEQLEKIDCALDQYMIIVKPRSISISTPWAYKMYDRMLVSTKEAFNMGQDAIIQTGEERIKNVLDIISGKVQNTDDKSLIPFLVSNILPNHKSSKSNKNMLWNIFEPVIFREHPVLTEIKKQLLDLGCLEAHMTGSGPAIYGLLKNKEKGEEILNKILSIKFTDKAGDAILLDGWIAKCLNHGAQVLPDTATEENDNGN